MFANLRTARRDTVHHALTHFLDALCLKREVDAVALTTLDGSFIAGAGRNVDVERMGIVGVESAARQKQWEDRLLFMHRFELNDRVLCLTSAGAPLSDDATIGGLCRILAVESQTLQ
jgi:hypothetical protein